MPRRRRNIPLYVMVSPEELEQLHARMDEAGVRNKRLCPQDGLKRLYSPC